MPHASISHAIHQLLFELSPSFAFANQRAKESRAARKRTTTGQARDLSSMESISLDFARKPIDFAPSSLHSVVDPRGHLTTV